MHILPLQLLLFKLCPLLHRSPGPVPVSTILGVSPIVWRNGVALGRFTPDGTFSLLRGGGCVWRIFLRDFPSFYALLLFISPLIRATCFGVPSDFSGTPSAKRCLLHST